jgi:hypothetical protein
LDYKQQCDEALHQAFDSSEDFSNSMKEGFEHFINARENKPAELVAKFIDGKMRSGASGLTEESRAPALAHTPIISYRPCCRISWSSSSTRLW